MKSSLGKAKGIKPRRVRISKHHIKTHTVQPGIHYKPKKMRTKKPEKVKPQTFGRTFTHEPKKLVPQASIMQKPKSDYSVDPVFLGLTLLILALLVGVIILIINLLKA